MDKKEFVPASIRSPMHVDFDSCMEHVDYNLERLSELLTNERRVTYLEILNYIVPIITNICKIVEPPTKKQRTYTFCLKTRFDSCREEDIENLKKEWKRIRGNHIYGRLKDSRNTAAVHVNSLHQGYTDTQKLLVEEAIYLIKREERLRDLISEIKSLIYNTEISVRKKESSPLNVDIMSIRGVKEPE